MNDGWSRDEEEEYDDDDADDEKRTPTDSAADKEAKHQSKRPPVLINHADEKRIFRYQRPSQKPFYFLTHILILLMRSHNPQAQEKLKPLIQRLWNPFKKYSVGKMQPM